jgi:hypothetical protein
LKIFHIWQACSQSFGVDSLIVGLAKLEKKILFQINKKKKIKISEFSKAEAKISMPMAWQRPC